MIQKKQWQDTVIGISVPPPKNTKLKLAIANQLRGRLFEAKQLFLDVLSQEPKNTVALYLLGTIEHQQNNTNQAIELISKAIELDPNYTDACYNLAVIFKDQGKLKEAANTYRKVIKLDANHSAAYNSLGTVLASQGKLKESIDTYRKLLKTNPNYTNARSNFIGCLNYDSKITQQEIFTESQQWDNIHATAKTYQLHNQVAKQRLRIGYVSPDFREHSVSYFFEPVIKEHDRKLFEVFCYAEVAKPDHKTEYFRRISDGWRSTVGMTDSAVAKCIYEDGIDILVDLAGHTFNNRLLAFAEHPAPVQITWFGYPNTTGLAAMDYRLTDNVADPIGEADNLHTESLIRLPNSFLCYAPPNVAPKINELPALKNGYVTFGCFNNIMKITPEVVSTWVSILRRVPKSRLLIKSRSFRDDETQKSYLEQFNKHDIDLKRIELYASVTTKLNHLASYNQIDIGLDPFPYNGTTTTCEALWMGVPVITLKGDRHASRVSASILTQINHKELITDSIADYVDKAVNLANNLTCLSTLRNELRDQMYTSPLCDAEGFTRDIETVYQEMWLSRLESN